MQENQNNGRIWNNGADSKQMWAVNGKQRIIWSSLILFR